MVGRIRFLHISTEQGDVAVQAEFMRWAAAFPGPLCESNTFFGGTGVIVHPMAKASKNAATVAERALTGEELHGMISAVEAVSQVELEASPKFTDHGIVRRNDDETESRQIITLTSPPHTVSARRKLNVPNVNYFPKMRVSNQTPSSCSALHKTTSKTPTPQTPPPSNLRVPKRLRGPSASSPRTCVPSPASTI